MKKLLLISLACLFLSCNVNKESETQPPITEEMKMIEAIGKAHNDCLDYVLEKMNGLPKTRSGKLSMPKTELQQITIEYTKEFVSKYEEVKLIYEEKINECIYNMAQKDAYNIKHEQISSFDFSDKQIDLIEKLNYIVDDEDTDLACMLTKIKEIENEAKLTLSGQDLTSILIICSVARNSFEYWHLSTEKWIDLSPIILTKSFSWKRLGKADVGGAIATAGGGGASWLLGFGPVGWKAWGALILGGAATGSIQSAIDQVWLVEKPEEVEAEVLGPVGDQSKPGLKKGL